MPDDATVHRTLSIWREFRPSRPLAHRSAGDSPVVFDSDSATEADSALYEEIYRWHVREDFLAGIGDDGDRSAVNNALKKLDPSNPPSVRHPGVLQDFICLARSTLNKGVVGPVLWDDTAADPLGRETHPVEVNSLLALTLHLEWILACFGDRPGISVSVR